MESDYGKIIQYRNTRKFILHSKNNDLWSAIEQRDAKWLAEIIQSVPAADRATVVDSHRISVKHRQSAINSHQHSYPLHEVCRRGWVDGVTLILDASVSKINHEDMNRMTPMHIATIHGHAPVIQVLLDRGAVLQDACVPFAIFGGHIELVTFFLELRPDLVGIVEHGKNLLGLASMSEHAAVLDMFLSMKPGTFCLMNPNVHWPIYYHPLYLAISKFRYQNAVMLIRAGCIDPDVGLEILKVIMKGDVVDLKFADLLVACLGLDNSYVSEETRIHIRGHVYFDWSLTSRLLGRYL